MKSSGRMISIGELATAVGVSVESLRYYESRGLLKPVGRRHNGYREFAATSVALLRFIKRAQSLGFTLLEVVELVKLREANWNNRSTRLLREATVAKVRDIDVRIAELRELRAELATLIANCDASCDAAPANSGKGGRLRASGREGAAVSSPDGGCALVDALDRGTVNSVAVKSVRSPKPARRPRNNVRKPGHTNNGR